MDAISIVVESRYGFVAKHKADSGNGTCMHEVIMGKMGKMVEAKLQKSVLIQL